MKLGRDTIFAVLLLVLFTAAGCGTSDGGSNTGAATSADEQPTESGKGGTALTKAQLIERGDAICAKADKQQTANVTTYLKTHPKVEATKAGQTQMVLEAGLPPLRVEWEELAALNPPASDEAEVEAIVDGIKLATAKAEEDPASVLVSPSPYAQVGKLAGKYGFKVCSDAL